MVKIYFRILCVHKIKYGEGIKSDEYHEKQDKGAYEFCFKK